MGREHLKTKEREAKNSKDIREQGERWEAKLDQGLGKNPWTAWEPSLCFRLARSCL